MPRPGKPNEPEEPLLFDLPLSPDGASDEPEDEEPPLRRKRPARESGRSGPVPVPTPEPELERDEEAVAAAPSHGFAGRGSRTAAGLADLVVHAAVGVLALFGCRGLGVKPELSAAPAFGVFLLSFSFLYVVLPLAFWGHTPGMAWAGITSRNRDGEPLTFDQTARRWLGAVLTLALVGLPLLLSIGGRTLTDWVSGSATYPVEEGEEG
jgi:uncharacterized RDD family membrane protein YckC